MVTSQILKPLYTIIDRREEDWPPDSALGKISYLSLHAKFIALRPSGWISLSMSFNSVYISLHKTLGTSKSLLTTKTPLSIEFCVSSFLTSSLTLPVPETHLVFSLNLWPVTSKNPKSLTSSKYSLHLLSLTEICALSPTLRTFLPLLLSQVVMVFSTMPHISGVGDEMWPPDSSCYFHTTPPSSSLKLPALNLMSSNYILYYLSFLQ